MNCLFVVVYTPCVNKSGQRCKLYYEVLPHCALSSVLSRTKELLRFKFGVYF